MGIFLGKQTNKQKTQALTMKKTCVGKKSKQE